MAVYRLRPLAEDDLEEIWAYSRDHWSARQADAYVGAIFDVMQALAEGRATARSANDDVPGLGLRRRNSGSHVVFFLRDGEDVDVVRVLHQSMDFAAHFPDEP